MGHTKEPSTMDYLRSQCSRFISGQCTTLRCIRRGGYSGSGGYNPEIATCEYWEAVAAVNFCAGIPTEQLEGTSLEEVVDALADNLPALDYINEGQWDEYSGSLTLTEDQWIVIRDAKNKLRNILSRFDAPTTEGEK